MGLLHQLQSFGNEALLQVKLRADTPSVRGGVQEAQLNPAVKEDVTGFRLHSNAFVGFGEFRRHSDCNPERESECRLCIGEWMLQMHVVFLASFWFLIVIVSYLFIRSGLPWC